MEGKWVRPLFWKTLQPRSDPHHSWYVGPTHLCVGPTSWVVWITLGVVRVFQNGGLYHCWIMEIQDKYRGEILNHPPPHTHTQNLLSNHFMFFQNLIYKTRDFLHFIPKPFARSWRGGGGNGSGEVRALWKSLKLGARTR